MIAALLLLACSGDSPPLERRVLHLQDGSVIRAPVRTVEGRFEIQLGGIVRRVDALEVVSSALERDLLARARAELDAVHPYAVGLRVEVARWMIAEGLSLEATSELDRVLRLVPDEPHALALLGSTPPRIDLGVERGQDESERASLMRAGARLCALGASPTKRELVVRALAATARDETSDSPSASPTLGEDLARELEAGATTRRVFATLALRRLRPGVAVGQLAVHAVLDGSVDVREGATLSLRDARDPSACGAVVRALASPSALIRSRAATALGRMGYPEAVEPLVKLLIAAAPAPAGGSGGGGGVRANFYSGLSTAYVQDYDLEIAQGASVANPIVQALTSGVVFDVTVGGTSSLPISTEAWDAASALTRLTGQRFGTDASAWQKWWAANRDGYAASARRSPRTSAGH